MQAIAPLVTKELAGLIVLALGSIGVKLAIETVKTAKKDADEDTIEIHLPWSALESFQDKIKRGFSMLVGKKTGAIHRKEYRGYLYEKDYLHVNEMEVYTQKGSVGIHVGACPQSGGPIFKPAKPGRTIKV